MPEATGYLPGRVPDLGRAPSARPWPGTESTSQGGIRVLQCTRLATSDPERGPGCGLLRTHTHPAQGDPDHPGGQGPDRRRPDRDRQDRRVRPADPHAPAPRAQAAPRARLDSHPRAGGAGGDERARLRALHRRERGGGLRRRPAPATGTDAPRGGRVPRRHPGPPARPPRTARAPARLCRGARPRRGGPHGRHGVCSRPEAHPQAPPTRAPDASRRPCPPS
jgi:hypothetical protein